MYGDRPCCSETSVTSIRCSESLPLFLSTVARRAATGGTHANYLPLSAHLAVDAFCNRHTLAANGAPGT
jgi:hypothetical protein